jgi:hypothetical protein
VLIRSPRQLIATIAYDHRNPVKAGMVLEPEEFDRSSARYWRSHGASSIPLLQRDELPFDMTWSDLRARVLEYQRHRQLDLAMEQFARSGVRLDTPEGAALLDTLLDEAGLPSAA